MQVQIKIPYKRVVKFCQKWRIIELALFGSVLREDFSPNSDIDVLVRIDESARYSLFDIVHIQEELSGLLGRKVDLVEKTAIESSRNYLRRKEILGTAQVVYAA